MICPLKLTNPNDQNGNLNCELDCAIRAVTIFDVQTEKDSEETVPVRAYYCGLMAIGHREVQLQNMIFEPLNPQPLIEEDTLSEENANIEENIEN